MSPRGKLDRTVAVETLRARVVAALRPYEITREPNTYEKGIGTLPLFPESTPKQGEAEHAEVDSRPASLQRDRGFG